MKLLCGTDFSPAANNAAQVATLLANALGDSLELASVVRSSAETVSVLAADGLVFDEAVRRETEGRLVEHAGQLSGVARAPVETRVLEGEPHLALAARAKEIDARMVVLGASERSAFVRWLLGSVAERTVRVSDVPVLIAPLGAGEPQLRAALQDWGTRTRPLRVLVGLRRDPASDAVIAFIKQLRRAAPCELTFLHVYWPPEEHERLGLPGPRDPFGRDLEVVADLERSMRARLRDLEGEGEIALDVQPGWGPIGVTLLSEAEARSFDVVVVGTEHRPAIERVLRGSISEDLIRSASRRLVVCVPPSPAPAPASLGLRAVPRIGTVLAATDFSETGNAAVKYAYALLRGQGGVAELCHVCEGPPSPGPFIEGRRRPELSPERRAELEANLRALVPSDAASCGIGTHLSVVQGGKAGEVIAQLAERLAVDAIAIGSHGRGGLATALMGSVAVDVTKRARRPVLLVRQADVV